MAPGRFEWWVSIVTSVQAGEAENVTAVPILSSGETTAHPTNQLAIGVSLEMLVRASPSMLTKQDGLGYGIPWDPYWRTLGDSPVRKGGPGHLWCGRTREQPNCVGRCQERLT